MEPQVKKISSCRVCTKNDFTRVFNFGPTPLANEFLKKELTDREEYFYPLEVYFCNNCHFLELGHVVDPQILFGNYVYVSSTSPVFIRHFEDFAKDVSEKYNINPRSLIVDIGSNDGILLKPFQKLNMRVLGVEPADHIAKEAMKAGVPTVADWFDVNLAKGVVREHGNATVVTATNVFAHIDDLDEVISGIKILLEKDGIFVMEAPYLVDFFEKKYFDLVYHEHLSYWSVRSLIKIFERFEMEVFDVWKVAAHGGTIRVFVKKNEGKYPREKRVDEFLRLEEENKLNDVNVYLNYQREVEENRVKLLKLLTDLKKKGKTIAAYGAPAKGNTLLNYFGIGTEILDFVVDDSPWKQGLYTPGKRIPVVSSQELYTKKPDYLLILAWNFADSIMKMHEKYSQGGGRFVVPVPKPTII
jgi:SAM-dependent methyltransferase